MAVRERGFGATVAAEHLAEEHGLRVDRETLRRWMLAAGLWTVNGSESRIDGGVYAKNISVSCCSGTAAFITGWRGADHKAAS